MAADQGGASDMGPTDQGSTDQGSTDLGADMPPGEDMPTCMNLCEADAQECAEGNRRRVCIEDERGCLVWSERACPEDEVCKEAGDRAACEPVSKCDAEAECDPTQYPTCQGARRTTCIRDDSSGCYRLVSEDCPADATCNANTAACECADNFPRCEAGALKCSAAGRPQVCKIGAGATCLRWHNQPVACDATQDEVCQDGQCVTKSDVCTSTCTNAQLGKGRCATTPGTYEICEPDANDPSCRRWTLKSCASASGTSTEDSAVRACAINTNKAILCARDPSTMTAVCDEVQCLAACTVVNDQPVCAR